jgi:hypothetical protein
MFVVFLCDLEGKIKHTTYIRWYLEVEREKIYKWKRQEEEVDEVRTKQVVTIIFILSHVFKNCSKVFNYVMFNCILSYPLGDINH